MSSHFSESLETLTRYQRYQSRVVNIGDIPMGGDNPIRVQSMTNTNTMDTLATVEQTIRLVDAGCEYVRITAPSVKEAQNLAAIKAELKKRGYTVPLIADIHFVPRAAEEAAKLVEKVRVNPGNYVDRKRFQELEYNQNEYQAELDRIEKRFTPLVNLCREEGTAMRIGSNHGSLSDRILSHYGDTPQGMVESAMEFVRICAANQYHELVISMKASNTRIMIQAYRLLVHQMHREGFSYPLHLGVTEAGDGDDARIKSSLGIGSLLRDGLGDTIRVSLTEAPEAEIPVALSIVKSIESLPQHQAIAPLSNLPINLFEYQRRETPATTSIGADNVPVVIADLSEMKEVNDDLLISAGYYFDLLSNTWISGDQGADILYFGQNTPDIRLSDNTLRLYDSEIWTDLMPKDSCYPLYTLDSYSSALVKHDVANFIHISTSTSIDELPRASNIIWLLGSDNEHQIADLRRFIFELMNMGIQQPVILLNRFTDQHRGEFLLAASAEIGSILNDGLADGIWLRSTQLETKDLNEIAFGVLQASRSRMTKTEYIACPSCGRTLFDLEEVTAQIRERTSHLKGVKIGIMGCIVNGPGEMADADFGYVGTGPGKISLYRGQMVVRPHVPQIEAVDSLIDLIKSEGYWIDP
ncbi:MAG: (E)-4-hydroxy-3-methylbut-2-enyl-diphosphate synthase [Candidatus Marinimicrobia bacterium]|jgi:(E)-4-hydroxy-3-methylbut-2-enyl-diphosphate synthase|nr:(E)-4-hydroxy-3-methylbut-2-enyl-diphosphate synthase [Candidatus Neomarinimicrobiota bacterium]MBT4360165.1 (E)-4-hydroxy-3-methylbut-2-enyl-diphosphate synthase [Candidatus Neomarinimicrobiota bacterium]MBT4715737.1 (E)-4-hydroxy-3-methylbut-2-enyl-diphosphate synthase [Candidatus Neomarinimicrobiota bacterium]MBT4947686.1 (E)-4-hydroxy-3-methylbut-2-enyl-diphosphate synthase [Candidatus Neomarinimicrobiota bacterium]MBT5268747.1 (E)-4-hydroxy-3-methylbut-2-enyl-diphosphate synthase [Candi